MRLFALRCPLPKPVIIMRADIFGNSVHPRTQTCLRKQTNLSMRAQMCGSKLSIDRSLVFDCKYAEVSNCKLWREIVFTEWTFSLLTDNSAR